MSLLMTCQPINVIFANFVKTHKIFEFIVYNVIKNERRLLNEFNGITESIG